MKWMLLSQLGWSGCTGGHTQTAGLRHQSIGKLPGCGSRPNGRRNWTPFKQSCLWRKSRVSWSRRCRV